MKIKIICVGKIKDNSLNSLAKEYIEKISYDAKLELLEIKDSNPEAEGKKSLELIDRIKDNKFIFALSEEGKEFTSKDFSEKMKQIDLSGKTIVFVIGGPFGLSREVKEKADMLLSLSKMTFTHEMCRIFLMEQIYREISIIKNKRYHK